MRSHNSGNIRSENLRIWAVKLKKNYFSKTKTYFHKKTYTTIIRTYWATKQESRSESKFWVTCRCLSDARWHYCRVVTRYMRSGINGERGGIRDHSPGIWDHNTWDRDQQCFCGVRDQNCENFWDQGSKFPMFLWSGIKILNVFVIRDQNVEQKYRISYEKKYLVTTLTLALNFL